MNLLDLIILIVLALTIYTETIRGFWLTCLDIGRVVLALIIGSLGYILGARIFHNLGLGLLFFIFFALSIVFIIPLLLKSTLPETKSLISKIITGFLGFVIGIFISLGVILILAPIPLLQNEINSSVIAQPILTIIPKIHYVADVLNLRMPSMGSTVLNFEEEGQPVIQRYVLKERVNFLHLNNSTCIECGAKVRFVGYKRRNGILVSPFFVCPACGRKSDGCQTFEGFHKIYGRCPIEVVEKSGPIDCGVWNNQRPVYPKGKCPICGRTLEFDYYELEKY